jgi:outer membrane lipopolysaccharide assembly protein LptE/RlpB
MLLAMSLLAGCGFHLRGEDSLKLSAGLSPMRITGLGSGDPLYGALRGALAEAGVSTTNSDATAQSFLVLSGREDRRRVMALNEAGKAIEYAMVEAVTFSLLDRERNVILADYRIVNENSYTDPTGDPLGKAAEQTLLRNSARQETVRQIMARLRYGTR